MFKRSYISLAKKILPELEFARIQREHNLFQGNWMQPRFKIGDLVFVPASGGPPYQVEITEINHEIVEGKDWVVYTTRPLWSDKAYLKVYDPWVIPINLDIGNI
jgi:hypothetical protein